MAITNGLTTLADVRASLMLGVADTTYDNDLERYIEAATPVIENITGPLIATAATYTANGGFHVINLPWPVRSITSVTVSGTVLAATDYVIDAAAGVLYAGTYGTGQFYCGVQNVVIVAQIGVVPPYPFNVVLAARELVRHWWQQGRQGNRPSFGNEFTDGQTTQPLPLGVSNRLRELLESSPRLGGFA